jgi:hypothetical protein
MLGVRSIPIAPIAPADLCQCVWHPAPFSSEGWFFELKHDGFRALARSATRVQILSRWGRPMAELRLPRHSVIMMSKPCRCGRSDDFPLGIPRGNLMLFGDVARANPFPSYRIAEAKGVKFDARHSPLLSTGRQAVATFGLLYVAFWVFGIIVAVCWIVLPFALIGTKPLLRQLIAEVRRNNELLDQRLPALRRPSPAEPTDGWTAGDRLKDFATKPLE